MKSATLLATWIVLMGMGTGMSQSAPPAALAEFTPADEASWRAIYSAKLTPDGRWFVYEIGPQQGAIGETFVVVRSIDGKVEKRYAAGGGELGSSRLAVSRSGRWIAFQVASRNSGRAAESAAPDVVLIDLETGDRRDFQAIRSFEFAGAPDEQQLLLAHAAEAADATSFTLSLTPLSGGEERSFAGVSEFRLSPQGVQLAAADAQSVQLYDLRTRVLISLEKHPSSAYSKLTWSPRGDGVAVLRRSAKSLTLAAFTGLRDGAVKAFQLDPEHFKSWPAGFVLAPRLQWRNDERGLFFGMVAKPLTATPGPAVPGLSVWHWQDPKLPGQRQTDAENPASYWGYVDVSRRHLVRLTDESLASVTLSAQGRYVLGYDVTRHGPQNASPLAATTSVSQLRDYFLIDLETGRRSEVVNALPVPGRPGLGFIPQLAPDGSELVYQNDEGDIIARHVPQGPPRNLSARLGTRFYLPENDPRTGRAIRDPDGFGSPRVQGWTTDSRNVLVSDHLDVWLLPLSGAAAVNLTGNGQRSNVAYRLVDLTDPPMTRAQGRTSLVDLARPMDFQFFELGTGWSGLARRLPDANAPEVLHREFADIRYVRAADAEVYVCARQTAVESLDYYRVDAQWRPDLRLTDSNPQQRRFRWSPGTRYLSYTTARGSTRHAILRLPAGYVDGRAWPTIVEIYKDQSAGIHGYRTLGPTSVSRLLQHGFAVLEPDIVPRVNEAGEAALEDVTAAVEAAVATGIVDRERVGLSGFSFGAYETNYIVTRTHLFRAAMAWSGMTDLWSWYGGAYAGRWPTSIYAERDQPYLDGPWWEHWESYVKNSPLTHARDLETPLLLVHGDQDMAVPFSQSLELFNSLHRLGDKPVVLLQYAGEGHVFGPDALRDVDVRKLQFFDHFLRGATAPGWLSEGLSRPAGQVAAVPETAS